MDFVPFLVPLMGYELVCLLPVSKQHHIANIYVSHPDRQLKENILRQFRHIDRTVIVSIDWPNGGYQIDVITDSENLKFLKNMNLNSSDTKLYSYPIYSSIYLLRLYEHSKVIYYNGLTKPYIQRKYTIADVWTKRGLLSSHAIIDLMKRYCVLNDIEIKRREDVYKLYTEFTQAGIEMFHVDKCLLMVYHCLIVSQSQ